MAYTSNFKPAKSLAGCLFLICAFIPTVASYGGQHQWTPQDPCPTEIIAVVPISSPFGTHDAVHEAMKTCNNISKLDLSIASFGCEIWPARYSLPFALDGSDRYLSHLRVLILEGYEFDYSEWGHIVPPRPHWSEEDGSWPSSSSNPIIAWGSGWYYRARWFVDRVQYQLTPSKWPCWWWDFGKAHAWYKWRNVPTQQRLKDNMELWLEAMDFSQIRELSITQRGSLKPKGSAVLHRLPLVLSNLRSLTIGGRWVDWKTELEEWEAEPGPLPKPKLKSPRPPRARDFILAFPPSSLTNLTWFESGTCDADVFNRVLQHHGVSLRQLEWTNTELENDPRPSLSTDQLRSLGNWAPGLTDLTIDLNRENDDWPYEKLEAIAQSLPNLTNLTIYLNLLPMPGQNKTEGMARLSDQFTISRRFAQPFLDTDASNEMFRFLRNSQSGSRLESLAFREGYWGNRELADWGLGGRWIEEVRAWATCNILRSDQPHSEDELWCQAGHNSDYEYYVNRAKEDEDKHLP
ncbi:hypothetical protein B0T10DRAFT_490371 [Thelonectria olida]|uniref:Uncharacterized protein n=1 Tax=Thelonectria olida TaxID=1576542 RepID=A0A9P9AQU1_9HYPO|nr:hypothetical protein B0T10DRAFT_490371 [Thelonectria olida]